MRLSNPGWMATSSIAGSSFWKNGSTIAAIIQAGTCGYFVTRKADTKSFIPEIPPPGIMRFMSMFSNGTTAYLQEDMLHCAYPDIYTWIEKHNRYSNWEA